nr:serine/threonine-protein kinase [uncultured Novosphingobium sp.]
MRAMMLIANRYEGTGGAAYGGMSEVHHLMDLHLDRKVVLKRVKKTADTSRLIDEQMSLLALRSKHVVELLDIVTYEVLGSEETGLILENISGSDLVEGTFTYGEEYLKTLWQIAAGLSDIHAAGIIHRDIKPHNIRCTDTGVIKIFDFGLSRREGIDNKTKSIIGTDGYMAPELFGSTTIGFSNSIDVFAFGQTALSLLEPIALRTSTDPTILCSVALSGADAGLKAVIGRCLSINPTDRPTMIEIRDLLAKLILFDKHKAAFYSGNNAYFLNAQKRSINLKTNAGNIAINYDGHRMVVTAINGNVSINRNMLSVGSEIASSGVIIFRPINGVPAFVAYDLSNPQVAV